MMQRHHQQSGEQHLAHQNQDQEQDHSHEDHDHQHHQHHQHQQLRHHHHHTSIVQTQPFPQACTPSCPYPHTHTHAQSHPSPAESAGGAAAAAAAGSPGGGAGVGSPDTGASGDNSAPQQHHYHHQYQHQQHHQQQQQQQHDTSPSSAPARLDGAEAHQASAAKRKMPYPDDAETSAGADTTASRQTRSKRNRYIAIACNECKRRKIKCNGEKPCQRCGNLKLDCLYTPNCCSNNFRDSEEFNIMSAQMEHLQKQVDGLARTMNELAMRSGTTGAAEPSSIGLRPVPVRPDPRASSSLSSAATHSPTPPPPPSTTTLSLTPSPMVTTHNQTQPWAAPVKQPYHGPASTGFNLDIAKRTIHSMGYNAAEENPEPPQQPTPQPHSPHSSSDAQDALLDYSLDDIIRHMRFYDEEIGIMYPFLEIEPLVSYIRSAYPMLVDTARRGVAPGSPNPFTSLQVLKVKMLLCTSIAIQAASDTNKAERMFALMEDRFNRMLMTDPSDVDNVVLLCLVAGYRWFTDNEVLGWRSMGHLMRMCQELGLHTLAGLQRIPEGKARTEALNMFWMIYTLDRRWAFSTGLPYALQDTDIDPNLPLPEKSRYLKAMVNYSRVAAKVWRHVTNMEPILARDVRQSDIESLDRDIMQWYEANVPDEVKIRSWDKEKATLTPSYNLRRLRLWTYLRFNQIRIWLYTPILHSATSIMTHPTYAQRVVDMARDTIRYLAHINATTDMYRRIQLFYHQFLTNAIAVLFLASVHAPVKFSSVCRDEFYMALELVKELSSKSWASQKLWRAVRGLKEVAPRFGMSQDDVPTKANQNGGHNGHNDHNDQNGHNFQQQKQQQQQQQQHGHQPATQGMQGVNMSMSMNMSVGMAMAPCIGMGLDAEMGIGAPSAMHPPQHQIVSPAPLSSIIHNMNPAAATTTPPTAADVSMDGTGAAHMPQGQSPSGTPPNGRLLQTEMSRMFEGYVNSTGDGVSDMMAGGNLGPAMGGGATVGMFGNGDEMFQIFRDLY